MESRIHTDAGVLRPMEFTPGPMGFSRSFAAFSQDILDRYAIWEKYPWSDAVIRYLEQEKQEEASGEKEPSSFFVTLQLLKIYLENEQGREKAAGEAKETGEAKESGKAKETEQETLTLRIETELGRLKAGYDKYFGILERLYREGRQMPQEECSRIWGLLKREAGRREAWENSRDEDGRGHITPYALGAPAVRLRRMAESHGRMPDSKALFRISVERQQREFYTEIVRSHVVRETVRQAERRLGRELNPSEYEALKDYGDSLERTRLAFYAARPDVRLYQETAALVLGLPTDGEGRTRNEAWEDSTLEANALKSSAGSERGSTEEGKPNGAEESEEIRRLLSELPDFISRAAVRELYAESVGSVEKRTKEPGRGEEEPGKPQKWAAGLREQRPAPEGYGQELVYRTESQDSLRLSKLWEQSTQEEKKRLLERIPQALRQAVFLWEETGREDVTFHSEEVVRTIAERIEAVREAGTAGHSEAAKEISRLLLELPDLISRTVVRELYTEDVKNTGKEKRETEEPRAIPEGYEEKQDFLPLAELWERTAPEERTHLLRRIPQAVRQAALLWEESSGKTGNSGPEKMLGTILERIEAAGGREAAGKQETAGSRESDKDLLSADAGTVAFASAETAAAREEGAAAPGNGETAASESAGVHPEAGRIQLAADAEASEEVGRLLLELPDWISRTAVQKLYEESAEKAEKEGMKPENRASEAREPRSAAPEGYGEENLVYRLENQDFLPLAELWERTAPEERTHLLRRIPQAVRQAALLWEESSGKTGKSGPEKMLETILERIEAVRGREAAGSQETAGSRESEQGLLSADAGTAAFAGAGTAAARKEGAAEIQWSADAEASEEFGRLLLELPDWISRTAVQKLYEEGAEKTEKEGMRSENRASEAREPRSAVPEGYGEENLVYRMENQDFLPLAELWERTVPEERTYLLRRIPRAVRQAVSLWAESSGETGNSGQMKMLEAVFERIEAAGSRKSEQGRLSADAKTSAFASAGTAAIRKEGTAALGNEETAASESAGIHPEAGKLQLAADAEASEEVGRLLSELPDWISRTAVQKLYEESTEKTEKEGMRPENRAGEVPEPRSVVPEGYGEENLVYRLENQDLVQLSTLWEQSGPEERTHLLRRIPRAVRQAVSMWAENSPEAGGPRQTKVLEAILERLEASQASEAFPHSGTSGSAGARRRAETAVPDNEAAESGGRFSRERQAASRKQMLLTALTWLVPQTSGPLLAAGAGRKEPETFSWIRSQILQGESVFPSAYPNPGESSMVYAAKAPHSFDIRQKEEGMQAIQELESRISRQEYIIRQEKMEREELQRRMKKQEDGEDTLWQSANMKITSKQGGDLSPDMLARLKEHLRKERIRYGAD